MSSLNIIMKITLLTIVSFAFVSVSCNKSDDHPQQITGDVEFYLLHDFTTVENSCEIDESTIVLNDTALLHYSDIITYNDESFEFEINDESMERIQNIEHWSFGVAFAVMANNSLVYTGYFIPMTSSMGCPWTVINLPILPGESKFQVKIGYPGPPSGIYIPDRRNDPILLEILKNDGKLI